MRELFYVHLLEKPGLVNSLGQDHWEMIDLLLVFLYLEGKIFASFGTVCKTFSFVCLQRNTSSKLCFKGWVWCLSSLLNLFCIYWLVYFIKMTTLNHFKLLSYSLIEYVGLNGMLMSRQGCFRIAPASLIPRILGSSQCLCRLNWITLPYFIYLFILTSLLCVLHFNDKNEVKQTSN